MFFEESNRATKDYPFLIEHSDVKYIPHFHDETEIVFILEGALNITLEDTSFILKKGDICIITPEIIHNLHSFESNKSFVIKLFPIIDVSNIRLFEPILKEGDKNYHIIKGLVSEIIRENSEKKPGYELAVNINAEKILLMILRNLKHTKLETGAKIKQTNKSELLNSVTYFLEAHYADEFSLEDVAKSLQYTKSYFCHRFKDVTGVTFWKYFTLFRLEKAIQKMKDFPNKRYTEIAGECGFKNIRSFNQSFKEYYRCSPREYARKYFTRDISKKTQA